MLHRHGHYERTVYFLDNQFLIVVYRFKCPECSHADGLLPSFVGKNQQAAWDIQETVLREQAAGASLADVAEKFDDVPGGPYTEKTLWRWVSRWGRELPQWISAAWAFLLKRIPHAKIRVGAKNPGRSGNGCLMLGIKCRPKRRSHRWKTFSSGFTGRHTQWRQRWAKGAGYLPRVEHQGLIAPVVDKTLGYYCRCSPILYAFRDA